MSEVEVFEFSLEVKPSAAASLDAYAKATGADPADVLMRVLEQIMVRDLFSAILGTAKAKDAPAIAPRPPSLTCNECGGFRSPTSKTGRCRRCYYESLRKPKPEPVILTCSECGKPRSAQSKSGKCRACAFAYSRAPKVVLLCVDCNKPRSIGSGMRCRDCYLGRIEARRAAPPPAPQPAAPPVLALPPPPAPSPPRVPISAREIPSPAPPPAKIDQRAEEVEVRVPAHVKRPVDPLAKRERPARTTPGDLAMSPEFQAQLDRIKAGAGIVEVRPFGKVVEGGSGSSLGVDM